MQGPTPVTGQMKSIGSEIRQVILDSGTEAVSALPAATRYPCAMISSRAGSFDDFCSGGSDMDSVIISAKSYRVTIAHSSVFNYVDFVTIFSNCF